jgi:hypothetical protein
MTGADPVRYTLGVSSKHKGTRRPISAAWLSAANAAVRSGEHGTHQEIADALEVSQGYVSGLIAGRYQTSTLLDALNKHLGLGSLGLVDEAGTPLIRELMQAAEGKDEETIRDLIRILNRLR